MNFKLFLLIFTLSIFLLKYVSIFIDIFDIFIKFKYSYIHNYRYFIPLSVSRMRISVSTDISVLGFYGYIGYIRDISVDIFT